MTQDSKTSPLARHPSRTLEPDDERRPPQLTLYTPSSDSDSARHVPGSPAAISPDSQREVETGTSSHPGRSNGEPHSPLEFRREMTMSREERPVPAEGSNKERAGDNEEDSDVEEDDVQGERTPWLHKPLPDRDGPWMRAGVEATQWTSLFYDLSVVAVLTVFSSSHEISEPSSIPTFISYFVIIYLIWHSQTQYDMRFQGNDIFHMFFKFLQIGLFLFQGAAAGNWSPGDIQTARSAGLYDQDATYEEQAERSFVTVVLAFIISRALLALQYAILIYTGHKAGRPMLHLVMTFGTLMFTVVTGIVAVCIPAHSTAATNAKLGIFYTGICVEVLEIWSEFIIKPLPRIPIGPLRERYGAFVLIILGEGFISLLKAFNLAISGLSSTDPSTYAQAFLAVVIIFLLFLFLYSDFHEPRKLSETRVLSWIILQFPLAFGLLLVLAGVVNIVQAISFLNGLDLVINKFSALGFTQDGSYTPNSDQIAMASGNNTKIITKYLNKLQLYPPITTELSTLLAYLQTPNPPVDPVLESRQYYGSAIIATLQVYNLNPSNEVGSAFEDLAGLNETYITNSTARDELQKASANGVVEVLVAAFQQVLPGVTWLLPTTGCVLLLATLRTAIWTRWPKRKHHHRRLSFILLLSTQTFFGVLLGLLGLLDLGHDNVDRGSLDNPLGNLNPLFRSLLNEIPLVAVAIILFVAYLAPRVVVRCIERAQRRKHTRQGVRRGSTGEGMDGA